MTAALYANEAETAADHHAGDFVSDAEIARRWGVGEKTARVALLALSRTPTFPRRDPLFANKRYWPAVKAFMDARYGLAVKSPGPVDGEEHFDVRASQYRERSRATMATARGPVGGSLAR